MDVVPDEGDRLIDKPVGKVLPLLARRQGVNPVGVEIGRRAAVGAAAHVEVKALGLGIELDVALALRPASRVAGEMPLAEKGVAVIGGLQPLGYGQVLEGKVDERLRGKESRGLRKKTSGSVGGHVEPGRRLAGQHRRPGRSTDRRGGVGTRKAHALGREAVNIRRVDHLITLNREVHPPEIIDHDEDDVRLPGLQRWTEKQAERKTGGGQRPGKTVFHIEAPSESSEG